MPCLEFVRDEPSTLVATLARDATVAHKNTHTLLLGREELEKYEFRLLPVLGLPQEEIGYRRLRFSVVYRRRVQLSMRFDVNISSHQNIEEREAY